MTTKTLVFVGPLPPPVHGQAVATQALHELLLDAGGHLHMVDNGPGARGGLWQRLCREVKAHALVFLAPAQTLYISVNTNAGILATIFLCLTGRLRRKRVVLHHHSYRGIGHKSLFLSVLVRAGGPGAVHVVNCPEMGRQLKARYSAVRRTMSFSNAGVVDSGLNPAQHGQSELVIGHMSNLTQEKGLGRTIAAFREIRQRWPSAKMHLAGPCAEEGAEQMIATARAEFGEHFRYFGPVYGDDKRQFLHGIDVFVFPSLYAVETQGIVNLEAMACGKPVVAFAQCCIPGDIGQHGGCAVPRDADFSQALVSYLQTYLQDRSGASQRARQQFESILENHAAERSELVQYLISSDVDAGGPCPGTSDAACC